MNSTRPLPDGTIIAGMKQEMLALKPTKRGRTEDDYVAHVVPPDENGESCLHCHRLAHRAFKQLVKHGLLELV
jgi:hypothetical protein